MQQVHMGKSLKNDQQISNEESPDPSVLPEIPGYHILIRPISVKEKTKGGILIPDSTREDMSYLTIVGKVLAVGNLAYKDIDKFPTGKWCDVGDYVCYGKHSGQKLYYKSTRLILLFDDQIMLKVEDPKDLDPTFNLTRGSN